MSYLSDFKGAEFPLFSGNPATGTNYNADSQASTQVGSPFRSADGRVFTIVQVGASAIASGLLVQSPASIGANHTGLASSTQAVGDYQITVTLGGTLATANQYAGGFAVISAGTGIGQTLRIASHPAGTSSGTVVLTLEDPISVATSSSDTKTSLTLPQYGSQNGTNVQTSGVIVSPTTFTGRVIGATLYPLTASTTTVPSYGWIQTAGAVAVLNHSGTTIGLDVGRSTGVAGAVDTYAVATNSRVGTATVAGEDAKSQLITLQL